MVFAMRLKGNVPQRYDFVVAGDFLECPAEILTRILLIPGEPFFESARQPGVPVSPSRRGSSPAQRNSTRTASSASDREGFGSGRPGTDLRMMPNAPGPFVFNSPLS